MIKNSLLYLAVSALIFTGFTSCDDDDDDHRAGVNTLVVENVSPTKDFVQSGTFKVSDEKPEILPGETATVTFYAAKGQALSFISKYTYANDIFFAPENPGIKLFQDNGKAITGDVSAQVKLWDNGTRINQAPGSNAGRGDGDSKNISMINGTDDQGHTYLPASDLMKLTLDFNEATSQFTLTIQNISRGKANETPFSPGVWAVSNLTNTGLVNDKPFFEPGKKASDGMTMLAEEGRTSTAEEWVKERTGIMTSLSPVVAVIYLGLENPIFTLGQKDNGRGLKEFVQKGDYAKLKETLEGMTLVRKVYILGNQPITPGEKVQSQIEALPGYNIAFVTKFEASNDWFFANKERLESTTLNNITDRVQLYDNGTGINQYPGAGNKQSMFGGTPDAEDKAISEVDNFYPVPKVSDLIKVTLQ